MNIRKATMIRISEAEGITIPKINWGERTIKVRQAHGLTAVCDKGVHVSPHTFRHTGAKVFVMDGGDPLTLQRYSDTQR